MSNEEEVYFDKLTEQAAKVNQTFAGALLEKGRQRFDVEARSICYNILRKKNWGLREIAEAFNKDGHGTIIHGIKNHDIAYKRGGYYMDNYDQLELEMSDDEESEVINTNRFNEKNRIKLEKLQDVNGKLREELFDIKKSTKLLLRSIKEQQSLTNLLNKSCS